MPPRWVLLFILQVTLGWGCLAPAMAQAVGDSRLPDDPQAESPASGEVEPTRADATTDVLPVR